MKILYVTTIGSTMSFFDSFIKTLIDRGHTVDIAANVNISPVSENYYEWGCRVFTLPCSRSPLDKNNFEAIRIIKHIADENQYDIIHCHTPIAAACTRLACNSLRKKGAKVFYTAHGFHFFKGAPLKNWLMYFPIEWVCSFLTDKIITINKEDYEFSKKHLHSKEAVYIPGVGIDTEYFSSKETNCIELRKTLGIPENHSILLSVGELNDNKNHETIIRALTKLKRKNITYLICGKGNKKEYLKALASSLTVENQVIFAGHRNDVADIYKISDVFVFPSKREGLPVSLMEAMASGLPCVASDVRGCKDLIENEKNGYLCHPTSVDEFAEKIMLCLSSDMNKLNFKVINQQILQKFDNINIFRKLNELYSIIN